MGWDPRYVAYFRCFDAHLYYEAHDVLEELWGDLEKTHPDWKFHKGLIQATGAFVHLKLHHGAPGHRVHGARLGPSARLFELAFGNLEGYRPRHLGLDLEAFLRLCHAFYDPLMASGCRENPWHPTLAMPASGLLQAAAGAAPGASVPRPGDPGS